MIRLYNRAWETSQEVSVEVFTEVPVISMSPETLIETIATAVKHWTKSHALLGLSVNKQGLSLRLLKPRA